MQAAETGSGKTGAFCLPVIQIVHETLRDRKAGKVVQVKGGVATGNKVVLNPYDRGDMLGKQYGTFNTSISIPHIPFQLYPLMVSCVSAESTGRGMGVGPLRGWSQENITLKPQLLTKVFVEWDGQLHKLRSN